MDRQAAEQLSDKLAAMPHYHVVTQSDDGRRSYSDGHDRATALRYAADLIAPTKGTREPGLTAVWIAKGNPGSCPLAHGDNDPADAEAAANFLYDVMGQEPYWSATR